MASWGIDSEPIQAGDIIVKYMYIIIIMIIIIINIAIIVIECQLFLSSKCIICLVLISNVRSYSRSLGINEISKIGAHLFADVYSLTSL